MAACCAPRRALAAVGTRGRVLRLPDLSQLRQLLLAAVGARAAARRQRRPSTPTARRPSTRSPSPSARCCRSLGRSGRPDHGRRHAGVVRRPRRRALPPGARRRSRRSSGWSPPPCCARASTSRSWPRARYIDIPYLALRRLGGGARGRAPAARHASVFVLLACAGLMRPEAWLLSGLYWLWCFRPATWPQRIRTRCSPASAPVIWIGARLVGDRRPAVLADPHQRPGRGARAHQRRAVRRSQHDA